MRKVYSVSQVNRYIRNMFAEDYFLHAVLVRGEVSNCKYHSSGHIYFTLKDASGTLSCVMFASRRRGLSFRMKDGDQVIAAGNVDVYERDGRYQLYAQQIMMDGVGALNERYEKWIEAYKDPLLVIDADHLDFENNPEDFAQITDKIDAELFGLFN